MVGGSHILDRPLSNPILYHVPNLSQGRTHSHVHPTNSRTQEPRILHSILHLDRSLAPFQRDRFYLLLACYASLLGHLAL